jgi:maleylpyruvate isomerase
MSVAAMDPNDLFAPTRLPGWSRAHVLVHLSRNADGLRNLLLSARTGEPLRMYPSLGAREADIIAGVTRPPEVVLADVLEASRRFLVEAAAFPDDRWAEQVAFTSGAPDPPLITAARVIELRLTEVEVHHVDLDVGYSFDDTPMVLAEQLLTNFVARRAESGARFALEVEGPLRIKTSDDPVVRGSVGAALAWLTGRSSEGMRREDGNPLPELPSFG